MNEKNQESRWKLDWNTTSKPPKISQWFVSLEGEGNAIGSPSIYIRLAGCRSAHCDFCDTAFSQFSANSAFKSIGEENLTLEIIDEIAKSHPERLTITGGEPLHSMKFFPDIYRWIDSIAPNGIKFLGIESNGNLLKDKENCLLLLESFNEIIRDHGITPTLTISPKLDATSCYDNQLSQEKVNKMYFETFDNISKYLQPYPVFYKFIYDFTGSYVDFKSEKVFIDYLINDLKVDRKHIMLMPFTPEDPLGFGIEFWEQSKDSTARAALRLGVVYSPRIHIDRKLD